MSLKCLINILFAKKNIILDNLIKIINKQYTGELKKTTTSD